MTTDKVLVSDRPLSVYQVHQNTKEIFKIMENNIK